MLAKPSRVTLIFFGEQHALRKTVQIRKSYAPADVRQTRRIETYEFLNGAIAPVAADDTGGKPRHWWTMPARTFKRAPSSTSSASGRLSKWRVCKMRRYVKAQPKEAAALTSRYPEYVKTSQKVQPVHTFISLTKEKARSTARQRLPNRGSGREMGSRTLTKSPPSAHSSSTRGCRLGNGQ